MSSPFRRMETSRWFLIHTINHGKSICVLAYVILSLLSSYKIGDSFFSLPLPEAQEMLTASTERIDDAVSDLEGKLTKLRDEMQELKVALYERFGRSINLES